MDRQALLRTLNAVKDGAMTPEEAAREAGRCLRCDHYGCGAMTGGRGE